MKADCEVGLLLKVLNENQKTFSRVNHHQIASEEMKETCKMCESKVVRLRIGKYKTNFVSDVIGYDHTELNAPVLVRSPKLNNVGPG